MPPPMPPPKKWVHSFEPRAPSKARAHGKLAPLPIPAAALGNKAANLFRMCALGLPVPPGFTLRSELCEHYHRHPTKKSWPKTLKGEVARALARLERASGARFGDAARPLLVSVRAGGRVSMPGMLDTILNLGLNNATVMGLVRQSDNPHFAYDCYRRFLHNYGELVRGIDSEAFENIWENYKLDSGYRSEAEMRPRDWLYVIRAFQKLIKDKSKKPFPQDVQVQLWDAIGAVFGSWQNERAQSWRRLHHIAEDDWGMAVSVQAMVFGNWDDMSATGVAFTRDPASGERKLYGEFLPNAQGEEVVAGVRTPYNLTRGAGGPSMQERMGGAYKTLARAATRLEKHFGDMQDIEFTVQQGKLWLLQTRTAKRSAAAALKIAVDMVREKRLSKKDALLRLEPQSLARMLLPQLAADASAAVIAEGLPAAPGAASGELVFTSAAAEAAAAQGRKVILVRPETSPEDIQGMVAAVGVLTARGGMTSHAAVVARGLGRPCVSGASRLQLDLPRQELKVGEHTLRAGEAVTIDGTSGKVMRGEVATAEPRLSRDFATVMRWTDEVRRLGVRANADTPRDLKAALAFGADGFGLVRTEQMFFAPDRIGVFRAMILCDAAERTQRSQELLRLQKKDFRELFRLAGKRPLTIRLLDPSLHEFLPHRHDDMVALARELKLSEADLRARVQKAEAVNPMLGHRGARLMVTHNEIYALQLQAVLEAAASARGASARSAPPVELMIPFVSAPRELAVLREQAEQIAKSTRRANARGARRARYRLGALIETPRAALLADELAAEADFLSFGSNDLTALTFGMSRDDSAAFLGAYLRRHILAHNPFLRLDEKGVGALMQLACERARRTKPKIPLAICGEHGGEPHSILRSAAMGLNYVSCSPYRVPLARLVAAQAALAD